MVPASPPAAAHVPERSRATVRTPAVWSSNVSSSALVCVSQSFTVESSLHDTKRRSPSPKRAARTQLLCLCGDKLWHYDNYFPN